MTNSQQTIKLDLSSLLTETSAHSDNKYTSSALELLLNGDKDQSGAGLFSNLTAAAKKGVQQLGPAIKAAGKDVIQDAVRSASPRERGRQMVSAIGEARDAIRDSPESLKALGNKVSNAVRDSPKRLRAALRNDDHSATSSATVNGDEQALVLIQNRLTNIENGIKEILRLLQSNQ
jgi:hypothetical protein